MLPSYDALWLLLDLDEETGGLMWRARPVEMFAEARAANSWNIRCAGRPALNAVNSAGYKVGAICGKRVSAHRVVWKMAYGTEPDVIDHLNGVTTDNCPLNLSNGTNSANHRNRGISRTNTSGEPGVYWNSTLGKWVAQVRTIGFSKGKSFGDFYDAVSWRREVAARHGFCQRYLPLDASN